MKLAITASGDRLDSDIDPRFGRCKYFIFVDPDTMDFIPVLNAATAGGAGIAAGQTVALHKANAVLTGDCGPNAYQVLSAAGIQVYTGVSGKVKDAIADYKTGKFKASGQASVDSHYGLSSGR
ncbi:MAG: NifB/NifX family molybdenum-iron cluster-binding protein [Dehalococcoidia bacterium]|nr:NifB/NifX family molybdenum-iron cluster-binding protein [Dehalococcoidia bacterium]